MKQNFFKNVVLSIILVLIPATYNSCSADFKFDGANGSLGQSSDGGGATGGNPMVPLSFLPFQPLSTTFKLEICIVGISAGNGTSFNAIPTGVPFVLSLDENGTALGDLPIPTGTYDRIQLLSRPARCSRSSSIVNTNDNGTINLVDIVKITFVGPLRTPINGVDWHLDVTPFLSGLAAARTTFDLGLLFQSTNGYLSP
jgi:hypothetical protein